MAKAKPSVKISNWDGVNKNKVRLYKLNKIRQLVCRNKDSKFYPKMLTFPGTKAYLERLVVGEKLVSSSDITAIQTYEKMSEGHNGELLLKELIKLRNKELKGMPIWPYNFEAFTRCYTTTGCSKPEGAKKKFNTDKVISKEMNKVVGVKGRYNVADLDYCGIFSAKNADSIENLMKNKVLDNKGVMFITHQKGRDARGGNLINILHGYLKENPMVDWDCIPYIHEEDKGYQYYVARYFLIPLYYVCKAFDNGYILKFDRLIEYRDKAGSYGLAVNMLQLIFNWISFDETIFEPAKKMVLREIETICREEYPYTNWVD
jgi:hypothetical protein